MPRRGILAGGNWVVDHVKLIRSWPAQDTLAFIVDHTRSNGGSPYNTLIDLARLGAPFPLAGIGLVGADEDGEEILRNCRTHGIDTTQLLATTEAVTSYTDVMTVQNTGRRTFFHQPGANALLDVGNFIFDTTQAKLFHLGYQLLLDRLDALDENGLPRACRVLQNARAAGLRTSLDCVSEDSQRFGTIVAPALPYVDILFANDFEAEKLTGIPLREGETIIPSAVEAAARALIGLGVRSWVVLHFPEAVYACSAMGDGLWQPSLEVPAAEIRGTAGAGDALAAGVLFGIHEDWPMPECLKLGVAVAAASLSEPTCSAGIPSLKDCQTLASRHGYRSLKGNASASLTREDTPISK